VSTVSEMENVSSVSEALPEPVTHELQLEVDGEEASDVTEVDQCDSPADSQPGATDGQPGEKEQPGQQAKDANITAGVSEEAAQPEVTPAPEVNNTPDGNRAADNETGLPVGAEPLDKAVEKENELPAGEPMANPAKELKQRVQSVRIATCVMCCCAQLHCQSSVRDAPL
jgi:hypothetical protein